MLGFTRLFSAASTGLAAGSDPACGHGQHMPFAAQVPEGSLCGSHWTWAPFICLLLWSAGAFCLSNSKGQHVWLMLDRGTEQGSTRSLTHCLQGLSAAH